MTSQRDAGRAGAPRLSQQFSISTACLAGTLDDKLHAAAAVGFTSVEVLEHDLVMATTAPREIREGAEALGLAISAYQPLHVEALPAALFAPALRRAERKLDVAHELGASVLVVCSTRSADGVDDDDVAAEQLHALAELAEQRQVRLAYEAVPWGRVSSVGQAWRIVERAGHANAGMCLDSFHVLSEGNDPGAVADIPGSKVHHVQLADATRTNMDVREWSLHYRMFPGQGSLDVAGFVERLSEAGYTGKLALEVFNDVYQQEDPRHTATDGMRSMLTLAETVVSRALSDIDADRADLPPPVPALGAVAFVEVAVDPISEPLLARALRTLGFHHAGQHRSKPVQLWQHGEARILLNSAPQRSIDPATAAVCAIGVEVSDPAVLARRAERLLAPQLPRLRGPDESDLTSVAAPDGTALFFCGEGEDGGWLGDFESTGESPLEPPRLSAVDRVSLTESVDDFDQAALFFRSVLGLRPAGWSETTAPFGLVRSWSASSPDGDVRITVTTSALRRGDWSPAVSNPQHVTFRTDDVMTAARDLRERGASLLAMSDNYYEDLVSRMDLAPDRVEELRELSILYDRDVRGEFLHFFTEIVGSRVFFEVVQRIGDYAGNGAPNSVALRMSAHRRQRLRTLATAPDVPASDHRHDYSLAHLTALSLSPPELVDAAAAAGYRYVGIRMTKVTVEEPHYPLTYDPALMRATKTHLAATGVEVLDVELARIASGDNPRDYLRFLEAGAELGARHVITQLPDADFSRKVDRFAQLCELARPLGLTLDLEFPSWTETPDLREAVRVLRAADQSNAGLLIDLLHFARSSSSVAELAELPREWFRFAHVCDAPAEIPPTTEGLIHTARFERLFPGEGGIDTRAILDALPDGIPYALEIPRATLVAQVGAKEHARLAINAARRHLDAVPANADG